MTHIGVLHRLIGGAATHCYLNQMIRVMSQEGFVLLNECNTFSLGYGWIRIIV